jgi:3-methylfumaryl-CoA hydratase
VIELTSPTAKSGRSGKLVLATYLHTILIPPGIAAEDTWNIVFREEDKEGDRTPPPAEPDPDSAAWQKELTLVNVMLFQFSAAIWNPHRIHYDYPYTTGTEAFSRLVIHGPLTAMLLLELVRDNHGDATITSFDMRAKAPMFAIIRSG